MARPTGRKLRTEIVEEATVLIQERGVSGFSYGDLANRLDVKAPSIHHHFRTKADLTAEVVSSYTERFSARVAELAPGTAIDRLRAYGQLFADVATNDRLCLCGSVSADWLAIDATTRRAVEHFFEVQQRWLEAEIRAGVAAGQLQSDLEPGDLALVVLAALEGALLIDRAGGASGSVSEQVNRTLGALVKGRS